jgi:Tol biopolymer transport system component/DNA-binding winged helix-turn-helix (wHTH) protein
MSTNARRDLDETGPNPAVRAPGAIANHSGGRQVPPVPAAYTFLNVTLDMRRQLLVRGTDEIRLRPRAFDVLRYLVANAGRLVSKQELMDAVWADVAVTDDSLVQCLIEIRRGLGEAEGCITTVRGRGYLLDCDVQPSSDADSSVPEEALASAPVVNSAAAAQVVSQTGDSRFRWMRTRPLVTVLGLVALVSASIVAVALLRSDVPIGRQANVVRFTISPPPGTAFGAGPWSALVWANIETTGIALSPDGSELVFVATDPSGRRNIWLRPLTTLDARQIPATEGATSVFWSPDSRSIGFFAGGKLKRLDLSGSGAVTVCDVPEGTGLYGTWGRDDILFAAPEGHEIFRVPVEGGSPARELVPDRTAREISVGWPLFLPDGLRFLYLARLPDREGRVKLAEPGKPTVPILSAISNVQWVDPDYLVFAREGTLMAQRFDLVERRLVGDVLLLAASVQYSRSTARTNFSTSQTGALVYQANSDLTQLVWYDRSGREVGRMEPQGDYYRHRISPEGHRVLFHRADPRLGTTDLWMRDLVRGVEGETRLTFDPSSEVSGVWLPDGRSVIFAAERNGPPHLFQKELEGGAETELLPSTQRRQAPTDISPDGRIVAFEQISDRGDYDLWTLRLDGPRRPTPLMTSTFNERGLRFSPPDGRFVTFTSDESGRAEVYVAPWPVLSARTRVSSGGGSAAQWSRDGRELYYASADGYLMAVPIHAQPSLEIGVPFRLFPMQGKWFWRDFDLSPDGKKFLAIVPQVMANEQPLTAVLNWPVQFRR